MRFVARLYLVMLLSLALLLPRVSVMLAELTGAERVLLCDGTSMVVLVLDDEGRPVHVAHADPCGVTLADLPLPAPQAGAARVLTAAVQASAVLEAPPALQGLPRLDPARAPPRA